MESYYLWSTAYYKVEYKIDSGSYQTANGNLLAIGAHASVTASVAHGSTITWKITDSFTSNNFTNMTEETQSESTIADCDPDLHFHHPLAIVLVVLKHLH